MISTMSHVNNSILELGGSGHYTGGGGGGKEKSVLFFSFTLSHSYGKIS